jgi:hypothetical protein
MRGGSRSLKMVLILVLAAGLAWAGKLDDESLGGIQLHARPSAVIAAYGQPQHKTNLPANACGEPCVGWEYSGPGLIVELCKDLSAKEEAARQLRVLEIRTDRNSKSKTSRGMMIWNTKSEVRASYPDIDVEVRTDGVVASLKERQRGDLVLEFQFKDDRVSQIRLYHHLQCGG